MNQYLPVKNLYYGNTLNLLRNEILYGGYFAALCGPAFVLSASAFTGVKLDIPLLLISYLLPLIVYSYDYYRDIDKDINSNSKRAIYLKKKAKQYPFILLFYIISLVSLLILFSNFNLMIFIVGIILSGLLYNVILKGLTKKIPVFKNIYTAITWALGGAFFPLFYYYLSIDLSFILAFFTIFFRCLINVMFFDLKDVENDEKEGLKTLPVILGKNLTIKFLHSLNIFSFIPLILGVYFNLVPLAALPLVMFCFYSFYYIRKAETAASKELETVSHTLADSEFVLWPMLLTVAKLLI